MDELDLLLQEIEELEQVLFNTVEVPALLIISNTEEILDMQLDYDVPISDWHIQNILVPCLDAWLDFNYPEYSKQEVAIVANSDSIVVSAHLS